MRRKDARVPDRAAEDGHEAREIGATAGKTHEEVLDEVVGRERRLRNEAREGSDAG